MAEPSPDPITRLNAALEGRYRIEREIGEGGMATVYLAEDLRHERKVALKVLKPELAAVVGAERFLAEIKTTANLQHPHILPLFDSGQAEEFLYYVMPFVEGESLRERLDRDHQLPVDEAVAIAEKVLGALQAAHEHGVIHRDIKPANILLSKGEPLVSDFGIALAIHGGGGHRLTETGLSLGSPYYMSPEQATGDLNLGPATDTYALGCVLYELLVGEPPYTGRTPQAILGKILSGGPESVIAQRAAVPPNVDAAILQALERLPADRFAAAQSFAAALANPGFRRSEHRLSSKATAGGERRTSTGSRLGPLLRWFAPFGAGGLVTLGIAGLVRWSSGAAGPVCTWYEGEPNTPSVPQVSCDLDNVQLGSLLAEFADNTGSGFVVSPQVSMFVTASLQRQDWDTALEAVFTNSGLVAHEDASGNISVSTLEELEEREAVEPLSTQIFAITYAEASELAEVLSPVLTERGQITVDPRTRTLTVSDVTRVHGIAEALISQLDVPVGSTAVR